MYAITQPPIPGLFARNSTTSFFKQDVVHHYHQIISIKLYLAKKASIPLVNLVAQYQLRVSFELQ